jgi:hypothetical protein
MTKTFYLETYDGDDIQPVLDHFGGNPIETAPKDGRLLRLLVDLSIIDLNDQCNPMQQSARYVWTVGHNNIVGSGAMDEWRIAGWNWDQDCFTEGFGKPVAWLPFFENPDLNV